MNAREKNAMTPLLWAAQHGHTDVVKLLLDRGADVNAKDTLGQTALSHGAFINGRTEIVRLLKQAEERLPESQVAKLSSGKVSEIKPPPSALPSSPKRQKKRVYTDIAGERWAVVIGISRYQDTRIPGLLRQMPRRSMIGLSHRMEVNMLLPE